MTIMGIPEQVFLVVLVLVGMGFQVRMWRELTAKRLAEKQSGARQPGAGFYPVGLLFCSGVEALAAHTFVTSRSDSFGLAITVAVLTAILCLGAAFGIAWLRPVPK